jgi:mono/diheme cytochrome c family protein
MTNKRILGVYILCSAIWLGFPATGFAGECPQDRKTITAPQEFLNMQNPLAPDERTLKAGENLFQNEARPIACKFCHGVKGDGKSGPDFESTPPPRNFTCAETMKKLPDGQLFWIIKNGSKNTSMFAFSDLKNNQIWQLVHYVRSFGK